jgi:hypothetical protein
LSERRDIADIREMILKYIMICDRMHRRIRCTRKKAKRVCGFFKGVFWGL